jgi:hypothetical protein
MSKSGTMYRYLPAKWMSTIARLRTRRQWKFDLGAALRKASRAGFALLVTATLVACATTDSRSPPMSAAEPDNLVADAQQTLRNFLRDPDQTWVQQNLDRA